MEEIKIPTHSDCIEVTPLTSKAELETFFSTHFQNAGTALFYLDYAVFFASFDGKNLIFPDNHEKVFHPEYIQKIRLFDNEKELYIWRTAPGAFQARLRVDNRGEQNTTVLETEPFLLGRVKKRENAFGIFHEDRGGNVAVPVDVLNNETDEYRLLVRYYLKYNRTICQMNFKDMRLVKISPFQVTT